ncbi:hypothetical protein [Halomonas koreensis]|uniref:SH3 domain-containing protein n=1 Tax=Halomonas koreensis TaxID=245385 RepID=A0ABU1G428_9GAMM|nr:hypothetical protein [Halomonas koreensis]MDR5867303.1 hypothetical protein [Halomonas koreensis]
MPQLSLSRRTVLAPTPGLAVQSGKRKKAVFGQPGDVVKIKGESLHNGVRWFKATLYRGDRRVGSGYLISTALVGQAGASSVLGS